MASKNFKKISNLKKFFAKESTLRFLTSALTFIAYPPVNASGADKNAQQNLKPIVLGRLFAICLFFVVTVQTTKMCVKAALPEYIANNGAAVIRSIQIEEQRSTDASKENLKEIFQKNTNNSDLGFVGNKDSKNLFVMYVDYACPHSKVAIRDVENFIKKDGIDMKVIINDINVLNRSTYVFEVTRLFASKHPEKFQELVFLLAKQDMSNLNEDSFASLVSQKFGVSKSEILDAIKSKEHEKSSKEQRALVAPIFQGVPMTITSKYIQVGTSNGAFFLRANQES